MEWSDFSISKKRCFIIYIEPPYLLYKVPNEMDIIIIAIEWACQLQDNGNLQTIVLVIPSLKRCGDNETRFMSEF